MRARDLAGHGCRLVLCARDGAALERAADGLRADGAEVVAACCDITDPRAPQRLIGAALESYGRLDIVVNNAGVIVVGPVSDAAFGDFESAMATMAMAPARLALAALPRLRDRGGRIVNVTSVGGKVSVPHLLPYCMAKFAAVAFSEGLRAELGGGPVTVTTAVPGLMRTGSHLQADADRAARRIVSAMRRRQPEVILTPAAQLGARGAALFPGLTARVLHLAAAALPDPAAEGPAITVGRELRPAMNEHLFGKVTALGRAAARRLNQAPQRDS